MVILLPDRRCARLAQDQSQVPDAVHTGAINRARTPAIYSMIIFHPTHHGTASQMNIGFRRHPSHEFPIRSIVATVQKFVTMRVEIDPIYEGFIEQSEKVLRSDRDDITWRAQARRVDPRQ